MYSPEELFDIAELARRAGVSSRTIRYYGELGLVRVEGRGPAGRRMYGQDSFDRLRFIVRLKKLGLTLEEIGEVNRAFDEGNTASMLRHLESLLHEHQRELVQRMNDLKTLQGELDAYLERIRQKRISLETKRSA